MLLRFKPLLIWLILASLSFAARAENNAQQAQQKETCHYYQFIKGTQELSDPANAVTAFVKNQWIDLENDLARGHGDTLSYLNSLAVCPYTLPEKFWQTQIKGLPYEQRASNFTQHYFATCFCARE